MATVYGDQGSNAAYRILFRGQNITVNFDANTAIINGLFGEETPNINIDEFMPDPVVVRYNRTLSVDHSLTEFMVKYMQLNGFGKVADYGTAVTVSLANLETGVRLTTSIVNIESGVATLYANWTIVNVWVEETSTGYADLATVFEDESNQGKTIIITASNVSGTIVSAGSVTLSERLTLGTGTTITALGTGRTIVLSGNAGFNIAGENVVIENVTITGSTTSHLVESYRDAFELEMNGVMIDGLTAGNMFYVHHENGMLTVSNTIIQNSTTAPTSSENTTGRILLFSIDTSPAYGTDVTFSGVDIVNHTINATSMFYINNPKVEGAYKDSSFLMENCNIGTETQAFTITNAEGVEFEGIIYNDKSIITVSGGENSVIYTGGNRFIYTVGEENSEAENTVDATIL